MRKQGISIDCHFVTTADNYILRLYHLVRPKNQSIGETSRPKSLPIFMMHGMLGSSQDFVLYPKKSAGKRNLIKPAVIIDTDHHSIRTIYAKILLEFQIYKYREFIFKKFPSSILFL